MYSAIEHVARIRCLSDWEGVNMVTLTAAFDCSDDKTREFFVMAGFVAPAKQWADFHVEWQARLAMDDLLYFHSQPFAHATTHPKKPFDKSWIGQEQRRRSLLSDLLDIIQSHAARKFGCILPLETFHTLSDGSRQDFAPKQIVLAARLLWAELEVWRRREKFRNQCELIFEDGDVGKGQLIDAMKEVSGQTPIFRHKIDDPKRDLVAFTPLQASDLLAYEIQKVTSLEGRPLNEVSVRFPYAQLEKGIPGDIRMLQTRGAGLIDEWVKVQKYFDEHPLGKTVH